MEAIEKIKIYSNGFDSSESLFEAKEQMPYNAICHLLLAIGEESKKIEPSLKETQSFISWVDIAGLRNRIAHDYRGIDRNIVFQIVKNELETLQKACEKLFHQLLIPESVIKDLLKDTFFKHLNYLLQ